MTKNPKYFEMRKRLKEREKARKLEEKQDEANLMILAIRGRELYQLERYQKQGLTLEEAVAAIKADIAGEWIKVRPGAQA